MPKLFFYVGKNRNWLKLISKGYFPDFIYLPKFFYFLITSLLFKPLRIIENIFFNRKIRRHLPNKNPIFILGHMRSGTTHLHNILSCDTNLTFPNTLQAYTFGFCILAQKFISPFIKSFTPKKRYMDNMQVSMNLPQEEEFSIFSISEHSFFYHMFFPKKANDFFTKYVLFENLTEREIKQWKHVFYSLMQKFSYIGNGKPLLIKNPVNTSRFEILMDIFPDARFVNIVRNPYEVFVSTKHLYNKLLPICQLQKLNKNKIEENILTFYELQMKKYCEKKHKINPENLIEIKYEELINEPTKTLKRIYDHFNLSDFENQNIHFQNYLKSISGYKTNTFEISKSDIEKVNKNWGFAFDEFKYTMQFC